MNIVETAAGNPAFSTLVTALKAAGLTEALSGAGPFTVFAPNDAAFAKLPSGTVADLVKPENKAKLVEILKLHVVSGKHMAAEFKDKTADVATLGGEKVQIKSAGGALHVGGAKVGTADVAASNGVIHIIDTVLMPAAVPAA
ncbi:fasciclin domain-containing protein [Tabrizicola sp. BL-A-41-H6]|uniref:fasciclin domain-containing protein n=1 Tax=Tabrizicola sp. BL-A-41-H6 TaxID=3421107 RepID=UPI003D66844A